MLPPSPELPEPPAGCDDDVLSAAEHGKELSFLVFCSTSGPPRRTCQCTWPNRPCPRWRRRLRLSTTSIPGPKVPGKQKAIYSIYIYIYMSTSMLLAGAQDLDISGPCPRRKAPWSHGHSTASNAGIRPAGLRVQKGCRKGSYLTLCFCGDLAMPGAGSVKFVDVICTG